MFLFWVKGYCATINYVIKGFLCVFDDGETLLTYRRNFVLGNLYRQAYWYAHCRVCTVKFSKLPIANDKLLLVYFWLITCCKLLFFFIYFIYCLVRKSFHNKCHLIFHRLNSKLYLLLYFSEGSILFWINIFLFCRRQEFLSTLENPLKLFIF